MFSLIVTTNGTRDYELNRLMKSLESQIYKDFEVIAVLQTNSKNTLDIVNRYNVKVHVIETERCSLSKARNIGLRLVKGDIIGFPDDDCWYPSSLLEDVSLLFKDNDVICCNVFDPDTNRYFSSRQSSNDIERITVFNAFKYPISVGIFTKNDGAEFDESLGAGTQWGSGEETDYILDKLLNKKKISYYKNINVYHPYINTKPGEMAQKSYNYGKGYGALVKKRIRMKQYGILVDLIITITRSVVGALVNVFIPAYRNKYIGRIKGIIYGLKNYNSETITNRMN